MQELIKSLQRKNQRGGSLGAKADIQNETLTGIVDRQCRMLYVERGQNCRNCNINTLMSILPVSILHNSESGRYRPIVADLDL